MIEFSTRLVLGRKKNFYQGVPGIVNCVQHSIGKDAHEILLWIKSC